jgi:hypothetical protein
MLSSLFHQADEEAKIVKREQDSTKAFAYG